MAGKYSYYGSYNGQAPLQPNIQSWLDATNRSTINILGNPSDNDPVSLWTDASGVGNNGTQGTAIRQPIWMDSGFGVNNTPYIQFAGQEWLEANGMAAIINGTNQPVSTIAIGEFNGLTGTQVFYGTSKSGNPFEFFALRKTGANIENYVKRSFDAVVKNISGTTPITISTPYSFISTDSGTSGEIFLNGTSENTGATNVSLMSSDTFTVGARYNPAVSNFSDRLDGKLAELIVYDRELTALELTTIINPYINSKYGI
jgi:hypothetical protein